jgi:hypothetical protein
MRKRLIGTAFVAVVIIAALLSSCGLGQKSMGSVTLSIGFQGQRSILPPISMDVTQYDVSAAGPGGATWGPDTITGTITIDRLVPGSWLFLVVGKNAAGDAIGAGTGSVDVIIGQDADLNITVHEYAGDGSFALDLSWEPDIVASPSWVGSLKDFANVTTDLAFTMDEVLCTATTAASPLHAGYFTLLTLLYDDPSGVMDGTEVLSTGAAEVVRIAQGRTTHGDLDLHCVQGYGQISLTLDLDFNDPLILTPTPALGSVTVYNGEANSFAISADVACTTVWYLRGQAIHVGATLNLDASAMELAEAYRLDAISFSTDGKRAASGTWTVTRDNTFSIHYTLTFGGEPLFVFSPVAPTPPENGRNFSHPGGALDVTFTGYGVPSGVYRLMMNSAVPVYWTGTGGSTNIADAALVTFPKSGTPYAFDFSPAGETWPPN